MMSERARNWFLKVVASLIAIKFLYSVIEPAINFLIPWLLAIATVLFLVSRWSGRKRWW